MTIRLDKLREEKDYTKQQVADILGVSKSMYARWENGKDIILTRRMNQLANYYNVSIDYMLGLSEERIRATQLKEIDLSLVAKRVSEIRNDYHETLREFVKRLKTSSSTWSAYETGKVLILGAFLLEICQNSNYSIDWILGRTNKKFR